MTSIFIIVRKESMTIGHGECGEFVNVAMVDPYDTNSPHPAFTSKEKADTYITSLPKHKAFNLTPYEIIVKE